MHDVELPSLKNAREDAASPQGPLPMVPDKGVPSSYSREGNGALVVAAGLGLGNAWGPYEQTGLTVGHVVILLIAPVTLAAAWRWKTARWNIVLLLVWFLGAAFTEFVVGESMHDVALVLSRPVAVLLSFLGAMWALQCRPAVVRVYVVTLVVGLMANIALFLRTSPSLDPWKYGYGPVATLAAVLVAFLLLARGKLLIPVLWLVAVALVSLVQGFRSEFLIVCGACAVTVLVGRRTPKLSGRRVLLVAVGVAAFAAAVPSGYGYLASHGWLGAEQEYRWERQSRVDGGVLLGARPEITASYVIIKDSPVVGSGLAPEVPQSVRNEFLEKLQSGSVDFNERRKNYYFGEGLYLHSVLFQLWVENGVAVVPGLLLPVLLVLLAMFTAVKQGSGAYVLLFSFLFLHLGWDVLFSPWPRLEGLYLGTAAAVAVLYRGMGTRPFTASPQP